MEDTQEAPARSFCVFLGTLAGGQAEQDLSKELQALIRKLQVDARSKGQDGTSRGELTLKLKVTVDAAAHANVDYTTAVKEPPKRRPKSVVYVTNEGHLVYENPRQQKLPLREVASKAEVREVDGSAEAREV